MSLQSFNSFTAGRAPASLIEELNHSWPVEKQSSRKEQNTVDSTNTFILLFYSLPTMQILFLTEREHGLPPTTEGVKLHVAL